MPNRDRFILRYDMEMAAQAEQAEVMIYSQIVSRKYNKEDPEVTAIDFDKMLKDAKAKGATKLRMRINSPGGSVYQAVAMRTMLMNSGFDEITASIEGLCASAATLLTCVPGMSVSIAEGSSYMIHNPSGVVWGTAKDLRHEAEVLEKMEQDCQAIYARRTGKSEDEIKIMMDKETWMTAKEAVEAGFCDALLDGASAVACVTEEQLAAMQLMYRHTPEMTAEKIENNPVSNTGEETNAATVTENTSTKKEENEMEIRDITMEQLQAENPQLLNAAIAAERQRVQDIDDLTLPGFEQMASEAKRDGTSAMEFQKKVVKAQREKGARYMEDRRQETAPAANVSGGDPGQHDRTNEDELKAYAREMSGYAAQAMANDVGMY